MIQHSLNQKIRYDLQVILRIISQEQGPRSSIDRCHGLLRSHDRYPAFAEWQRQPLFRSPRR